MSRSRPVFVAAVVAACSASLVAAEAAGPWFSRDTHAPESGEFFVWHASGAEDWPPDCPVRGGAGEVR